LGGKTAQRIEQAQLKPPSSSPSLKPITTDNQLPTPPNEEDSAGGTSKLKSVAPFKSNANSEYGGWPTPRSNVASCASSPPQLDDIELPNFGDGHSFEDTSAMNTLFLGSQHYNFPDPSAKISPASSNGAEPNHEDVENWRMHHFEDGLPPRGIQDAPFDSEALPLGWRGVDSPNGSSASDMNPFSDANVEKEAYHTNFNELHIPYSP
jgi:ubiquitin carboxyl-terminal hydrolase 4/11/15